VAQPSGPEKKNEARGDSQIGGDHEICAEDVANGEVCGRRENKSIDDGEEDLRECKTEGALADYARGRAKPLVAAELRGARYDEQKDYSADRDCLKAENRSAQQNGEKAECAQEFARHQGVFTLKGISPREM
jgi:hypothetical protein